MLRHRSGKGPDGAARTVAQSMKQFVYLMEFPQSVAEGHSLCAPHQGA